MRSANFDHLRPISEQLFRLGFLAERFFAEDPNTSLIKSRQFAETLLKEIAAHTGAYRPELREGPRAFGARSNTHGTWAALRRKR